MLDFGIFFGRILVGLALVLAGRSSSKPVRSGSSRPCWR